MKWRVILFIVVLLTLVYILIHMAMHHVGLLYQESVQKQKSVSVHAVAEETKLPKKKEIWCVYFFADWCSPCIQMKPNWVHSTIVKELKKYKGTKYKKTYVPFKINIDKRPDLVKRYNIKGIPCIILMDDSGKEFGRYSGYDHNKQSQELRRLREFLIRGPVWKNK